MRKKVKKFTSMALAITLFSSLISASAMEQISESIIQNTELFENSNIDSEFVDIVEFEEDSDELSEVPYEPTVHTEIVTDDIEFPEEGVIKVIPDDETQGNVAPMSLTSEQSAIWSAIYGEQFGNDYLKPYEKSEKTQQVTGNTNRLVIEETDLVLPGKNGLNVVIKRKHDNQDYNESYSGSRSIGNYHNTIHVRFIYAFTNLTTNETVYVGFLSEDQFYMYMYNGCNVTSFNTNFLQTYKNEDTNVTIQYYNFEDIYENITTNTECDRLEYNSNIERIKEVVH